MDFFLCNDLFAGILNLTLAPNRKKKRIKWAEDTIDNEHMGKHKSKSKDNTILTIYFTMPCVV